MKKKLSSDALALLAVVVVGLFILAVLGDPMSHSVQIIKVDDQALVVITLDRYYDNAPRSKVLRDAARELQKEIIEENDR